MFSRLQKLLVCPSHKRTIAYLDKVGENHDGAVLEWRKSILKSKSLVCKTNSQTRMHASMHVDHNYFINVHVEQTFFEQTNFINVYMHFTHPCMCICDLRPIIIIHDIIIVLYRTATTNWIRPMCQSDPGMQ